MSFVYAIGSSPLEELTPKWVVYKEFPQPYMDMKYTPPRVCVGQVIEWHIGKAYGYQGDHAIVTEHHLKTIFTVQKKYDTLEELLSEHFADLL